ncbi:uncharacterized protein LOC143030214 [Oratosquilla oratoria]|uniref:uncharacterized protein LOC143030214 n=1 Tax=Oratosquilla oratoria TaxID=337810 RepID=UPI003F75DD91
MQYADDAVYPSSYPQTLQENLDIVNNTYAASGLCDDAKKTKVLLVQQNIDTIPPFTIGDEVITTVDSFKYLGSTLSAYNMENKIQTRIRLVFTSFGKLLNQLFLNSDLSIGTKVKVYQAIYLSICCMTMKSGLYIRSRPGDWKLSTFAIILNITWHDRIPHVKILQKASAITNP